VTTSELDETVRNWQLPEDGRLLDRIERMIRPAVMDSRFLASPTATVCGLQYHLGGEQDTAELAELAAITADDRVDFRMGNANNLPFEDSQFSVVWSQCALHHDDAWLREFHRVTAPGGRLAITFDVRRQKPDKHSPRWRLQDITAILQGLGYSVDHAEDITERDIELGWKVLDRKLSEREDEFAAVLGKDWVRYAHKEFAGEIKRMRDGRWGNARIVATKY